MSFGILQGTLMAAVALALLLGGDLRNLVLLRVRASWLLVGALGLRVALLVLHTPTIRWGEPLILGLVAIGAALNWQLPGVPLIGCGLALNAAVVAANGGIMPFSASAALAVGRQAAGPSGQVTGTNALADQEGPGSHLTWLDDRIPIVPTKQLISIGDIAVAVGGAWLMIGVSRPSRLTALAPQRSLFKPKPPPPSGRRGSC